MTVDGRAASRLTVDGCVDDWQAPSAVAADLGITKQAVSKQVAKFGARLPRRGAGRGLRIHRPTFDELRRAAHDPAQDLRNRHQVSGVPRAPAPRAEAATVLPFEPPAEPRAPRGGDKTSYDEAAARHMQARADLAEMDAARKRGELLPVAEVEAAMGVVAERIGAAIGTLKGKAADLYAASQSGGESGLQRRLSQLVDDTLRGVHEALSETAAEALASSPDDAAVPPPEPPED